MQIKQEKQARKTKQKANSPKTATAHQSVEADVRCSVICNNEQGKKNSKILMVDMTQRGSDKTLRGYVIVDDQASKTLLNECVPEYFEGPNSHISDKLLTIKTL